MKKIYIVGSFVLLFVIFGVLQVSAIDIKRVPDKDLIQQEKRLIGEIIMFGGDILENGWLLADGSEVSRTEYAALFSVYGVRYGEGDGSTTFNLPNLLGRAPVGYDPSQSEFNVLGKTGGEKTHVLTINEMPSHRHASIKRQPASFQDGGGLTKWNIQDTAIDTSGAGWAGGDQPHNNLQPYLAINFFVKAK